MTSLLFYLFILYPYLSNLRLTEAGDDVSDDEGEDNANAPPDPPANPNDEFDFENYDKDDTSKLSAHFIAETIFCLNN